jgi:PTS system mannose-specific IIB component/fructoselysine and glucoselysine-specific PTS system IIB component
MSWLLQRVDDRLIHGQVLVAWGERMRPARIWVVDEAVAASAWERELLAGAAPNAEVRVVTVAAMADAWAGEAAAPGGAFLLVRDLRTALALVEAGAPVARFNLGGLHYAPGKVKVNEYIYLDDADRARARALLARGVALEVQDVPGARPEPLAALDPASAPA